MELMICDKVNFGISEENKTLRDSLIAGLKDIKDSRGLVPALEVTLDATHGGYVNRNYAMYKPDGQRNSSKSFFTPYPKPILTEHDDEKSPVGRVIDAEFVPLAEPDETKPKSKIRIKGLITDSDAIQKVLDGRYMTVSISGRPKTPPTCSICNEKAGMFGCKEDHIRGQVYDGKVCHLIFDELEYSEVSFVNKPADQSGTHAAGVVSMRVVEAPSMDSDAQKMYSEAVQKFKNSEPVADATTPVPPVVPPATNDVTCEACGKVFDYSKVQEVAMGIMVIVECPHCKIQVNQEGKKIIDSNDCPECNEIVWSESEIAEVAKIVAEDGDTLEDAKLTTEQRKGMAKGTFCGPDRSYPVPDCSHGANAKARATQQVKSGKLSAGAAAKIKACANRKMKSMGCGGSDGLTTGNIIVDALIEMVNELKSSYEADLAAIRTQTKSSSDAMTDELAKIATEFTLVKESLAKADDKHKQDLNQVSDLTKKLKLEKTKNVLFISLILGKDSILNTFGGKNIEERTASYEKKLTEFKDISIEELTIREEEFLTELTKQAIVRLDIMGPVDPKLDKTIKDHRNKKQRLESWWKEGQ